MTMTRKDYKAIADCINCSLDYHSNKRVNTANLIATLCDYFKQDNPRFDLELFRKACLKQEGE